MKALILAAGFGTRLKEIIHDRPKVMAPINGKPFLEYVLSNLCKNNISEVVIAIGYLGDFIKDYFGDGASFGVKIKYSYHPYPLGTGGAVKLFEFEKSPREPYFVINGDTYIDTKFSKILDFHLKKKAAITIGVVKRNVVGNSGFAIVGKNGQISSFVEKPKGKQAGFVNCGLYVFTPKVINTIGRVKRFSLEEDVFPKISNRGTLYGFEISEDFIDIGRPKDYYFAKEVLTNKREKVIEVRTPIRVSFAGGGTDLPAFFEKHEGCVLGAAIKNFAHVRLKPLDLPLIKVKLSDYSKEEVYPLNKILLYDGSVFDHCKAIINKLNPQTGAEITIWSDFPPSSGLGSSSAFTVALIKAFFDLANKDIKKDKLARLAIEVEREELNIPGGWQDQYLSVFGGLNFIKFHKNRKVEVLPLRLSKKLIKELENSLLLLYLGGKRNEKSQQEQLNKNLNSKKTITALLDLKEITQEMKKLLEKGDLNGFGSVLHKSWLVKKKTSREISTSFVDKIYTVAKRAGALGGKLLGAGGGGSFLLFVETNSKKSVMAKLKPFGVRVIPFVFDFGGVKTNHYEN